MIDKFFDFIDDYVDLESIAYFALNHPYFILVLVFVSPFIYFALCALLEPIKEAISSYIDNLTNGF